MQQTTLPGPDAYLEGLISVGNKNGTTLMGRNHVSALDPDPIHKLSAVHIISEVVLVTDNHVRASKSWTSFWIEANQGLFTNNLSNAQILVLGPNIKIDPNPILP